MKYNIVELRTETVSSYRRYGARRMMAENLPSMKDAKRELARFKNIDEEKKCDVIPWDDRSHTSYGFMRDVRTVIEPADAPALD